MTEMKTLIRTVAVCGVSNRALKLFIGPLSKRQHGAVQLAALLDTDPLRFEVCKRQYPEYAAIPCYPAHDFDAMLSQVMPHALFVSGTDHTHIDYILGGLNAGHGKRGVRGAGDGHAVLPPLVGEGSRAGRDGG